VERDIRADDGIVMKKDIINFQYSRLRVMAITILLKLHSKVFCPCLFSSFHYFFGNQIEIILFVSIFYLTLLENIVCFLVKNPPNYAFYQIRDENP
jgi:hypothetical protein